jgi:D-alanyl-D-alanine carboxypeptidase
VRQCTDFYHGIGSVTKTFTVTGILQLADQGKLGLDPIGKYIDGVPQGEKITIRDLARMQSGLFTYSNSAAFGQTVDADPRRPFTPQQLLDHRARGSTTPRPTQSCWAWWWRSCRAGRCRTTSVTTSPRHLA